MKNTSQHIASSVNVFDVFAHLFVFSFYVRERVRSVQQRTFSRLKHKRAAQLTYTIHT